MKKKSTTEKPNVTNALSKPIQWDGPNEFPLGLLGNQTFEERQQEYEQREREAYERAQKKLLDKLPLLASHFGLSTLVPGWEIDLCLRLAEHQFKGFQIQYGKQVRRPKEWNFERYMQLYADVERAKREYKLKHIRRPGDKDAITSLVKGVTNFAKGKYTPPPGVSNAEAIKTLRNHLSYARNPKYNDHSHFLKKHADPLLQKTMIEAIIKVWGNP